MTYNIIPVSKPRMTQRDRWKKRPVVLKYHAYKDELRLRGVKLPDRHHVTFILPMPASWSKKKKKSLYGKPHQQRPDADNLIKGLWDALFEEDSHIWDFRVTKIWGTEGMIKVEPLG
jgi:Holliday junction resolvase RusA-like endonuclease